MTRAPKLPPGIRRLPSGSLRWEKMVEGRRFSGTARTVTEARTAMSQIVADASRGGVVDPSTVTVAEYLEGWLKGKEKTRAQRTNEIQRGHLKRWIAPQIGTKRHIELLMNEGGARLLMPLPDLEAVAREHGDKPQAIMGLSELSGASLPAALRRWVRQDFGDCRAAFEIQGRYVQDVASWNVRLPFWKWSRVPEVALEHPDVMLHSLGNGRVLGTVTG